MNEKKYNKLLWLSKYMFPLLVVEKNWWFIKCNKIEIINFLFFKKNKEANIWRNNKYLKSWPCFLDWFFSCCSEYEFEYNMSKIKLNFSSFHFLYIFFVGIESIFNFLASVRFELKIKNRISPHESTLLTYSNFCIDLFLHKKH